MSPGKYTSCIPAPSKGSRDPRLEAERRLYLCSRQLEQIVPEASRAGVS
jgi:hypothetical protein